MRTPRRYSYKGLTGCVTQRKSRQTKTLVGLYHAGQADIDGDPENPWATVCEEHGCLVSHPTLELAHSSMADPTEWCGFAFNDHAASKVG